MNKYIFVVLSLCFLLLQLAQAEEKVKVKVYLDCVLERLVDEEEVDGRLDCVDLKLGYFKNTSLANAKTPAEADLKLIVRRLSLNNEVEFQFTTSWQGGASYSWPGLRLNASMDLDDMTEKILTFLDQLTMPFIRIANSGNEAPAPTQEKESPYYIAPAINASGSSQQGSSSMDVSAMVYGNYSTPKWRIMGNVWAGYEGSNIKTTAYSQGTNSKISYMGGYGGVVRDLGKAGKGHWNIAIFASDETVRNAIEIDGPSDMPESALNNIARQTAFRVGTEWIAVPFLTETSNGNIAVHYSLGVEHHKYISPESFEEMRELFARHTVEVYVARYQIFDKVDLKLGATGFASSFRNQQILGTSGSINVKYKISPRVTLGATASVEYAKNRVMSPTEGTKSFMGLTSGNTPLTYNGSVSLTFNLGNIRIFNREQRWKN